MAWLAVDKDGSEYIYENKPIEKIYTWDSDNYIELPKGTIEKILGRKLTWNDEPIELK